MKLYKKSSILSSNSNNDIQINTKNNVFSTSMASIIQYRTTSNNIRPNDLTTQNTKSIHTYIKPFKSVIPLHIYQTWNTLQLPTKMKQNVELLKKQNPEFTHHLYDDLMCASFIKDNYDEDTLYAYNKLKPGAFKADLWRYCMLYKMGGVYLDIKHRCINGFKLLSLTDKEYWVKDTCIESGKHGIYQAIFSCLPKNNVLLKCIKDIVHFVKHNLYTTNCLSVTGPMLACKHVNKKDIDNILYTLDDNKYVLDITTNTCVLDIYPEYRLEQKKYGSTLHYSAMWRMRNIYNYVYLPISITEKKNGEKRYNFKNVYTLSTYIIKKYPIALAPSKILEYGGNKNIHKNIHKNKKEKYFLCCNNFYSKHNNIKRCYKNYYFIICTDLNNVYIRQSEPFHIIYSNKLVYCLMFNDYNDNNFEILYMVGGVVYSKLVSKSWIKNSLRWLTL